jgi:hypothetical protein
MRPRSSGEPASSRGARCSYGCSYVYRVIMQLFVVFRVALSHLVLHLLMHCILVICCSLQAVCRCFSLTRGHRRQMRKYMTLPMQLMCTAWNSCKVMHGTLHLRAVTLQMMGKVYSFHFAIRIWRRTVAYIVYLMSFFWLNILRTFSGVGSVPDRLASTWR